MKDSDSIMPDLGMISLAIPGATDSVWRLILSWFALFVITIIQGISGHWHRMTLTDSIVKV